MKHIRLIFSFLVFSFILFVGPAAHAQTTINIGETSVLTSADNGNANMLIAQNAALSQTATIQSLSFYVTKAGGNLRLGIYDATGSGGSAGKLLAQTNSFAPKTGWNTQNVVTPVSLAAGTYWLTYLPSSNTLAFVKSLTGSTSYYNFSFAAMPATFSASHTNATVHWSLYATLTAAPASPVNGQCGSSNGANLTSAPTTNLCIAGTASAVTGTGPWTWACNGTGGGMNSSCLANLLINGACGSANGVAVSSAPKTNLCTAGATSAVTGTGPWAWTCTGQNGGTIASCTAPLLAPVNGQCGAANGVAVSSAPASGLCSTGNATGVTGTGPWNWGCNGTNGGTNSSCSAPVATVNGQCGPANGIAVTNAPSTGLCTAGLATSISGTGPWNWGCSGSGGGTSDSCLAPVAPTNGQCGPANGVGVTNAPTTGLCTAGSASTIGGTGPWNWTCNGNNGGTNSSCSAPVAQATITIGETTNFPTLDNGNANLVITQSATLTQQATLQSMSFYVRTASGQLRMGIYDSTGPSGGPGALVAQTNAFTPVVGWNTVSASAVTLNPGTYWLSYFASSNTLAFSKQNNYGSCYYFNQTFGAMPTTFSLSPSNCGGPVTWSLYASLVATGVTVPGPTNGQCGTADETPTSVAPTANLCNVGTGSSVSGTGPWTWNCAGSNGGTTTMCAAAPPIYPLEVSGRHLVDQTGAPFMIVGDAPQDIINIPLTGPASMDFYFSDRLSKGFNSMWIAALCDNYDTCPSDGSTYDGIEPFTGMLSGNGCPAAGKPVCYDMTTPNPAFFARIDAILNKAAAYGMVVFLNHISTDGCDSTFWQQAVRNNGLTNAQTFGAYLGNRYKNFPNVIWFTGNDFQCWQNPPDDALQAAVVTGIKSAGDTHLQTDELSYYESTTKDDTGPLGSQMDLNGVYSYYPTYDEMRHAYNQSLEPFFLEEADYENETETFSSGLTPMLDLRKEAYWTILSGATGYLYGNHYTWSFDAGWTTNLDTVGVTHLGYWKGLFASIDWYNLVPDLTNQVLVSGQGTYSSTGSVSSSSYATAAYTANANETLAVVYVPAERQVTIDLTKFGSNIQAQWYDPTNGTYTQIGSSLANSGFLAVTPTTKNSAGDPDWVLVVKGQPLGQ